MYNQLNSTPYATFETHESNVRSYCRAFPAVFVTAQGSILRDENGGRCLDFLSGAGALNYGHNNPAIIGPVTDYLTSGGILHGLDLHTRAKRDFIETFQSVILEPRGMHYKLQFPGPTGTNAVEAALKLARKITGRTNVVAFSNSFHGMTQGALAATANQFKRNGAGMHLSGVTHMPYDGFFGSDIDTMSLIEQQLRNSESGISAPAAFIVETVQGEGGLNVASAAWLTRLERLAKDIGALLIVDDIQAGIGRTGRFFSFEEMDLSPDIVLLSKSLSGFGSPFALVLIRPDLDVWALGEHNGTFRGNNLAFVGATAAIRHFWSDQTFQASIDARSQQAIAGLKNIVANSPEGALGIKGRGLYLGLGCRDNALPSRISTELFSRGLMIETCGHRDHVLKLLPPLSVTQAEMTEALDMIGDAFTRAFQPQAVEA